MLLAFLRGSDLDGLDTERLDGHWRRERVVVVGDGTRLDVRSDKRHALHLGNLPRAANNRALFAYLVCPR